MTDIDAARIFVHGHARLVDRRRFAHLVDGAPADLVLAAIGAYRNPDGGIGALDPDTRTPTSQPIPVSYALGMLAELPPSPERQSLALGALDWLTTVSNPDGGVPFLLPSATGYPAAFWMQPSAESSLLATVQLAAGGLRLGVDHPWLDPASRYCWERIETAAPDGDAYTFKYAVDFLDATPDHDRAEAVLAGLAGRVPADGRIRVAGGAEGEQLDPLAVAPRPDHAGARLFRAEVIAEALDFLAAGQREDGGWDFDWDHWNPAADWESRGVVTVGAVQTLLAYGRA
jgi:hypothetical protein